MRCKRVELFGFKSFAEKTKIAFERGVTAIVGPNGCGKSNIADSIKWVLGEQRPTALRGSSMEDVIFNGTDNREPINIAEVSLTLSNENKTLPIAYDEVTVTRRIYRSGESEYLLNKTRVRLRDIQELFHDTGLGKESYSLIEQGKIDLILSTRPDDRRFIFEEAAGITKYKSKKQEALRKLEHTVNNLQRANDIINEVSRQIRSIERQAQKAQKYKEKFEKLKELEVKNSYQQHLQLKKENHITLSKRQDLKEKENTLLSEINEIDKKIELDRDRLHAIEEKISNLEIHKIDIAGSIENNSSKVELNRERIKELKDKMNVLNGQKESLNERINNLNEQTKDAKLKLDEIENSKGEKNKILQEKEQLLIKLNKEIEESNKIVRKNRSEIINLVSNETKINNELTEVKANLQNINARLRRLKLEKEDVEANIEESSQKYSNLETKRQEIITNLSNLKNNDEQLSQQLEEVRDELNSLKDKLVGFTHELAAFKSKLNFLKDLKERFEGYSKSVKTLLIYARENRLPFKGLHDSIANLIRVKNGYEVPVEMALGANVQNIVIETQEQAEEAISFLKTNNLGWVNFLPLSNFTPIDSKHLRESTHQHLENNQDITLKTLDPLSKFVDTDDEYKAVIAFLLSNTYLVKDTREAKDLLRELAQSDLDIRFVTQAGEIVTKNYIAGGSYRPQEESSLIGRDTKINKLQKDLRITEEEIIQQEGTLHDKEKIIEELSEKKDNIGKLIHQEDIKKANIQSELNTVGDDLKKFEDEITLTDSEIEESQEAKNNLLQRQQNYEVELNNTRERNSEVQNIVTTNQLSIEQESTQIQEILVKITQIKTELSSVDKLYSNKADTCNVLEKSIKEAKDATEIIENEIDVSNERITQLEQQIKHLISSNDKLTSEKESIEVRFNTVNLDKQSMLSRLKEQDIHLRQKQTQLNDFREGLHSFEVKNTEYSLRLENVKDRVLNTYNVNLDEVQVQIEDDINWAQVEEDAKKLKRQLESMGNVNLVAIDEHQELKDRYNFLTHQRQDLEEAQESLHKAIQKINRTTTKMFKETFEKIQQTFEEFFKLLFGGGKARLVLVDENNILESGIEIIARPPGKKLQNIMLLSGGEKALCAIALLFAVFKVKPSPFCILDEIDAPLDEANIGRFANVLREFVKTSQFIIITHNKKTIGMADVMYGVTMAESGVSKIVSVKFVDDKDKEKEPATASPVR